MEQTDKSKMWDHSIGQKDWALQKRRLKNIYIYINTGDYYRLKEEIKNSETKKLKETEEA